ncbi:MAG: hypothetical protein EZS28_023312 [Streblomastix strix]|uniref:Uncharacterized protein n=1 Tax=Streblomastix strix TaxID=222440 RepID=A0A5J4VF28_9EUKA|nr:MAG: hypothetical protein EZS28_023312 [Streblomastix strix]
MDNQIERVERSKRKRVTQTVIDLLDDWEAELVTEDSLELVTPHPFMENIFRKNCEFFQKGVYSMCVYSRVRENGSSIPSITHKYIHCCCIFKGEQSNYDRRSDKIGTTLVHRKCPGLQLKKQLIEASSLKIVSKVAQLSKQFHISHAAPGSNEMIAIIKASMNLQKAFPNESSDTLAPKLNASIIKRTICNINFERWNDSSYACSRCPCTSDGIARLFASLTKDLSVLRTLVAGSTTDGAPALIAGLSLFSESNYSKYLPKNLVRGLHSRSDRLVHLPYEPGDRFYAFIKQPKKTWSIRKNLLSNQMDWIISFCKMGIRTYLADNRCQFGQANSLYQI